MIYDKLENLGKYTILHPGIKKINEFLEDIDNTVLNLGENRVFENEIFLIFQKKITSNDFQEFEYHKKYLDLHIVNKGSERINIGFNIVKEIEQYDINNDFGLVRCDKYSELILEEGYFVLFFPNELHLPNLIAQESELIEKYVVKIQN